MSMNIVWFLVIGALAGWLAGLLTKGRGFGIIGNVIVGVVGAVIGGHIFQFVGVSAGGGLWGSLITALIGALVLLFLRTYPDRRHVCDGGDVGCSFRRIARSNMSILQGLPTTKCAQIAPSPRVAATTGVCFVALLDPIDIGPSSRASHPSRPGHNASRVNGRDRFYLIRKG